MIATALRQSARIDQARFPRRLEAQVKITDRKGYCALGIFVAAIILFAVGVYYLTARGRSNDARTGDGIPLASSQPG